MLLPCRQCGGIAVLVDQLGSGMPDGSRTAAARALWFMARDDDNTHAISKVRLGQTCDMLQQLWRVLSSSMMEAASEATQAQDARKSMCFCGLPVSTCA